MTSLSERADQHANGTALAPAPQYTAPAAGEPLPILDFSDNPDYPKPEMVPVHEAWLRVRHDVGSVAKADQHIETNQKTGQKFVKYHFRGVEAALNAFGPATLRHGVNVLAVDMETTYRDTQSSRGSKMREATITTTWQIIGPMGDSLPLLKSAGESLDSGDKGTAKAQSLALRALLFNTGMIPTGEPEPESAPVERGHAPQRTAEQYRDEILEPRTTVERIDQIGYEVAQAHMMQVLVPNETGEDERLDSIAFRIRSERAAARGQGGAA